MRPLRSSPWAFMCQDEGDRHHGTPEGTLKRVLRGAGRKCGINCSLRASYCQQEEGGCCRSCSQGEKRHTQALEHWPGQPYPQIKRHVSEGGKLRLAQTASTDILPYVG